MKRSLLLNIPSAAPKLKTYPDHTATIIGGLLGAGKTTYLAQLLRGNPDMEAAIVMNERGTDVDGRRIREAIQGTRQQLVTVDGACGCCEGADDMQSAIGQAADKSVHLIAEFSGLADALRAIALFTARKMRVRMAYLLHCGEARKGGALTDKRELIPAVIPALRAADVICLTHWEGSAHNLNEIKKAIGAIRDGQLDHTFALHAPRKGVETFMDDTAAPTRASIKALLETEPHTTADTFFFTRSESPNELQPVGYTTDKRFSKRSLTQLLELNGVIRAKGVAKFWRGGLVEKREFNWTDGTLTIEGVAEKESTTFVVFTSTNQHAGFSDALANIPDMHSEPDDYRFNHDPDLAASLDLYTSGTPDEVRTLIAAKTATLVGQYGEYMGLEAERNTSTDPDTKATLEASQARLGDDMTYPDPLTWIKYKHEAYQGSEGAISTVGDFLAHCTKSPTYICGKRLAFLQEYWHKTFGKPLLGENGHFTNEKDLTAVMGEPQLFDVVRSPDFIQQWHRYEYYGEMRKGAWRVAKWQSF